MTIRMRITAGSTAATATLNDTTAARAIAAALPIETKGSTWGDEIYFAVPVNAALEDGQEVVTIGDLGY